MTDRTDDLFDLIKSMTKSEKRYFRLFASLNSRTKVNKYVQLFDLIDTRRVHDEEVVRREFAAKFTARHFSETKYYLHQTILRALHAYGAEKSIDVSLSTMLDQARILYRKKLYHQCRRQLKKTRDEAVGSERWSVAVEALEIEHQILMKEGADAMPRIDLLLEDVNRLRRAWSGTVDQWTAYTRLLTLNHLVGYPQGPAELAAYHDAMSKVSARDEIATPSADIYRHYSIAIYREAMYDYRGALETYVALLPLIESSGRYRAPDHLAVTPVLSCICLLSIKARDAETFFRYHPLLLNKICRDPKSPEFEGYLRALVLRMDIHIVMGEFERALETSAELREAVRNRRGRLPVNLEAHIGTALFTVHFGLGRHSSAIDHLNSLLALKNRGLPAHRYVMARVLQIIVHFERGDHDLVESLLRSIHRYFAGHKLAYRHEAAILAFVRRALRSEPDRDRTPLFQSLLDDIRPLQNDPFERAFTERFDLIPWLESKITGRPLSQILRARFEEAKPLEVESDVTDTESTAVGNGVGNPSECPADGDERHGIVGQNSFLADC